MEVIRFLIQSSINGKINTNEIQKWYRQLFHLEL